MDKVTVSSKGQIAIPKTIRDALNLLEGTRLTLDVRGQEIVLSKEPAWKKLEGAAAGIGLIAQQGKAHGAALQSPGDEGLNGLAAIPRMKCLKRRVEDRTGDTRIEFGNRDFCVLDM